LSNAVADLIAFIQHSQQSVWYGTASGSERDKDSSWNLDLLCILMCTNNASCLGTAG